MIINEVETVDAVVTESNLLKQNSVVNPTKSKSNSIIKLDNNGGIDISQYTKAELDQYKSVAVALNVKDNNSILNYGLEIQNKLANNSDTFLTNIKSFDAGDVGETITNMLTQINMIEIDPTEQSSMKRFLMKIPLVKKIVQTSKGLLQKYDTVSNNVDAIVTKLDKGRLTIFKDNTALQNLFDADLGLIADLEQLIIGGKIKLAELEAEVAEMEANPENYEPYEIADKREFVTRLSKKIGDMMLTRIVTIQTLPQIRLVQDNNSTMVEKIQSSITTTIPIWKGQIAIAVALMRQKAIADVDNAMYEATNTMLTKNASMLKTNSIQIAKQNERGVVDVEALKKVQADLVETLVGVKKVKDDGEIARRAAAKIMDELENKLQETIGDKFSTVGDGKKIEAQQPQPTIRLGKTNE